MSSNNDTPGVLIAGTDTGVGKTFVGCGLAAALVERGCRVGVGKPFESGVDEDGVPRDAAALRRFAGSDAPLERICPARFRRPLAPAVAAWDEGEADLDFVLGQMNALRGECSVFLVEAAGGLLSPLSRTLAAPDLARALTLPVLVVAANRLGAINHTLLTIEALDRRAIAIAGVILNEPDPERPACADSNRSYLDSVLHVPLLGVVPRYEAESTPAGLAGHMEKHVDIATLLERISASV